MQLKHESLVPGKRRFLSGSWLKVIALLSMLIDHTASVLMSKSEYILISLAGRSLSLYTAMRMIGRSAFPLYAFLLVEGFLYTKDRRKYGARLLLFALISEIPWNLEHTGTWHGPSQNVFFTLFLGFLGLCVLEALLKAEGKHAQKLVCVLLALFAVSVFLRADYGSSGFGFILVMYVLREAPVIRAVIGCSFLSSRWQVFPAFVCISLYNGERGFIKGKAAKILFYAIYPAHLLLLYWIKAKTVGY